MTDRQIRAALLAVYVFLTAWAATGFERTPEAVLLSVTASIGGYLSPRLKAQET